MAANAWAHFFLVVLWGNDRYQRGHTALFSGYSLPEHTEHICTVF